MKIEEFVDNCRKAASYGLQFFSSGNMSCRLNEELVLMSASRSWLSEITEEQVAICELETGKCVNGLRPTVESVFHLGVLKNRSDVNVVYHFQSPWATSIACGGAEDMDFFVIPEIPIYIGKPVVVPPLMPGSVELAEATIEAMKTADLAILKNHGLITVGEDYRSVIEKAGFFELACQILMTNKNAELLPCEILDKIEVYKRSR